jgi:outer membrane protein
MKNASLILNGVLLVAVVVLYILHFSSGKPSGSNFTGNSSTPSDLKIAYVNQDTLLKYFDFVTVNKGKLDAKAKSFDEQLAARQQSLQKLAQSYQAEAGNRTINEVRALEADLQKRGENFQLFQQSLSQQMMQAQAEVGEEFYSKVTDYLKNYSKERGIAVVIKYDRESDLLFGGDSLDITKDILKGLNDAWKEEQANPVKKDSTGVKGK